MALHPRATPHAPSPTAFRASRQDAGPGLQQADQEAEEEALAALWIRLSNLGRELRRASQDLSDPSDHDVYLMILQHRRPQLELAVG